MSLGGTHAVLRLLSVPYAVVKELSWTEASCTGDAQSNWVLLPSMMTEDYICSKVPFYTHV